MITTYKISPRSDRQGFDIHIISADGIRQIMLDFKTEAEANAWVAFDKEQDRIVAESRVMAPSCHA